MSATTTSRKRQLNEAQDTEQSTSAKEAKISKPEIQKGSLPQNDVISSSEDQIRFTDDVMKKQQLLLEQELSPEVRKNLQEMIEKRNSQLKRELQDIKVQSIVVADNEELQHKKYQKGEEKPKAKNILKKLPCEMICRIFRYLPDKDLFNQMLSDRFFEKSAGYVLQRRKFSLYSLGTKYGKETILEVNRTHGYYHLKVENASAICEGYEEKKGNNLTRAIYLLFTYYNCSATKVHSFNSDEIPLTMEAFFGPAPNEPGEKIKIGRLAIEMTSYAAILFRWFCPTRIEVWNFPPRFIHASQEELKQLVVGIDEIAFFGEDLNVGMVDRLMEACDATVITMRDGKFWSDASIFSVIKANVNCDNKGARTIQMRYSSRSNNQWKMLFAILMNSYDENPARDVQCTIGMPKCDFEVHDDCVKLFLY